MERDKGKKLLRSIWERYRYVLLVALAGVVLLLWPQGGAGTSADTAAAQPAAQTLDDTETRMAALLGKIDGVGQLELMLTVESDGERELAADTELSYSGDTAAPDDYTRRSETVILSDGGTDAPVVTRETGPTYRGAVVVCQGGGSAEVRLAVTQAVAALTGLSTDRITVVKWAS